MKIRVPAVYVVLLVTLSIAAIVFPLSFHAQANRDSTLYVSTVGSDNWSGKLKAPNPKGTDGPLLTLAAARDRIRSARRIAPSTAPTAVLIRGGVYRLAAPFVLEPEDSGGQKQPMTYAAYPGERPIINGGRQISGFQKAGQYLWTVEIPEVRDGKWSFRQLFVNQRRAQRARSPNIGFYRMVKPEAETSPFQLKFRDKEIKPSWGERGDVEVIALCAWFEIRMPIQRVDETSRLATLSGDVVHSFGLEDDARYYIENAPEALDYTEEWYLDRKTGVLSYIPAWGEDPAKSVFVAPVLTSLLRLEGKPLEGKLVRHVKIQGLTFRDADWDVGLRGLASAQSAIEVDSAIKAVGAVDCSLEQCTITGVGGYALHLGEGCQRNRILANQIFDVGAGGIKLGEAKGGKRFGEMVEYASEAQRNRENVVSDNEIHNLGRVFPSAVGVWIGHQSIANTVSHNHIYDTYYTGISVGWTWSYDPNQCYGHKIEFNHIHHIGRGMLSDMGGIYTLGVQPGTVIRNNLIHDISASTCCYGAWGIYTDQGSSNILIENNVVYRVDHGGYVHHFGRYNTIRNNIFAFGKGAQVMFTDPEDHLSISFERNIILWNEGFPLQGVFENEKSWPECSLESEPGSPSHQAAPCRRFHFDHNLYYDLRGGGDGIYIYNGSWSNWQERGNDMNSVIADPQFVDALNYDFRLKPNSPALKLGFKPIDLTKVGPRR